MTAQLHIIQTSHFNEKGMWILDYKGFEYETLPLKNPADRSELARLSGGKSLTTPMLVDGDTVIGDTTQLALYMDKRFPENPLIPTEEPLRTECLILDDWADNGLAVHTRRWFMGYLRTKAPDFGKERILGGLNPTMQSILWPLVIRKITQAFNATPENCRVSAECISEELRLVQQRLRDREFLVGDRFTLADLAICAFMLPLTEIGHWRNDPEFAPVFAWRGRIVEQHGRRRTGSDEIPDRAERLKRGLAGAEAVAQAA